MQDYLNQQTETLALSTKIEGIGLRNQQYYDYINSILSIDVTHLRSQ